jgi:hypothetical protein
LDVIPFRNELNIKLKKPWKINPSCINKEKKEIIDNEGEILWKGIIENGKEVEGNGIIKKEYDHKIAIYNGKKKFKNLK